MAEGNAKRLVFGVCIALLVLVSVSVASAGTIYVPDDYAKIQWAVDNASAGDTIIVRDGTYTENVIVDKQLRLKSENGSANCIVEAAVSNENVFGVIEDYVTIKGFTITGATGHQWKEEDWLSGYSGISVDNKNHCNILNNKIFNNTWGVFLDKSSNNILANNTISNSIGHGITLNRSSNNNIVSNNTAYLNGWDGINLDSSNNTISSNNCSLNSYDGIDLDSSSNNNIVSNNTAYLNGWEGIILDSSTNNTISNNNCSLNSYDGIYLVGFSSNNNIITDNVASNNGNDGIDLDYYSSNNTISSNNCSLNNDDGIDLDNSSDNSVSNNNCSLNNDDGIYLDSSSNNTLTNNIASNNMEEGIDLGYSSNNNIITDNVASNNSDDGIDLDYSSNNVMRNNKMSKNSYNLEVDGDELSHYINDIDTSNTVDGKPIYYWVNHRDEQIPGDAGFVGVVNSTNITVKDLTLTNNDKGILFVATNNSRIENVSVSNNFDGIALGGSSNNTITNNNASNNEYGISLIYSSNSSLASNTCEDNKVSGITLWNSSYNTVSRNTINSNNATGMAVRFSNYNTISNNFAVSNAGDGIWLGNASGNIISYNNASYNTVHNGISLGASYNNKVVNNTALSNYENGICLYNGSTNNQLINNTLSWNNAHGIGVHEFSDNNTILKNNISENDVGIGLTNSSSNKIYINNFINNTDKDVHSDSTNIWNSTSKITYTYKGSEFENYLGNYWSDYYTGSDSDGNGIGDTPYSIDSDADNYPLMEPWENYFKPVENQPTIIGWYNNITKDNATELTINESECVYFNATADQPINIWNWFVNGTDQSHNFDNFTYCGWTVNGTYTVAVNATSSNGTSNTVGWTITVNDITPPPPVTGLSATAGDNQITWTWTNPAVPDFDHVMVYLDGVWKTNTSGTSYKATGLGSGTTHTIATRTVDTSGNINSTWVNNTATTSTPAPVSSGYHGGGGAPRDSDDDGYSDIQEMLAGTDPNDPSSYPGALPATPTPTITATVTPSPTMTPATTPIPTQTPAPASTATPAQPTPISWVVIGIVLLVLAGIILVYIYIQRR